MSIDFSIYQKLYINDRMKKKGGIIMLEIKEVRKIKNLTQKEVAQQCDITESTYKTYENYKTKPNVLIAIKIAEVLNIPVERIFSEAHYKKDI
ncbi:MAG: helix-turn-helix transcriptional regulator [Sulfolobaceae archaeon]